MIHLLDNFLTNKECDTYINLICERIKNKDRQPFTIDANSINEKYKDLELATLFVDRLKQYNVVEFENVIPNDLIMWAKYTPGGHFGLHTDTGLFYDKILNMKTRYTLLIYLNDDYGGGETVFFNENFIPIQTIQPRRGSCLVFDIDLWHKGNEVLDSEKYWIGCELIDKMI